MQACITIELNEREDARIIGYLSLVTSICNPFMTWCDGPWKNISHIHDDLNQKKAPIIAGLMLPLQSKSLLHLPNADFCLSTRLFVHFDILNSAWASC